MRVPDVGVPRREPEITTPREPITTSPEQPERGGEPEREPDRNEPRRRA
ncbi:hypothetical protein [Paludifilum halophilum]|nr:hypothetical protein [Paludifilum halophilum]